MGIRDKIIEIACDTYFRVYFVHNTIALITQALYFHHYDEGSMWSCLIRLQSLSLKCENMEVCLVEVGWS